MCMHVRACACVHVCVSHLVAEELDEERNELLERLGLAEDGAECRQHRRNRHAHILVAAHHTKPQNHK